ncbi:hypothetical protein [Mollivirus kamchatka]|nr:hypothetical protein [Mollivirus kamchatka]
MSTAVATPGYQPYGYVKTETEREYTAAPIRTQTYAPPLAPAGAASATGQRQDLAAAMSNMSLGGRQQQQQRQPTPAAAQTGSIGVPVLQGQTRRPRRTNSATGQRGSSASGQRAAGSRPPPRTSYNPASQRPANIAPIVDEEGDVEFVARPTASRVRAPPSATLGTVKSTYGWLANQASLDAAIQRFLESHVACEKNYNANPIVLQGGQAMPFADAIRAYLSDIDYLVANKSLDGRKFESIVQMLYRSERIPAAFTSSLARGVGLDVFTDQTGAAVYEHAGRQALSDQTKVSSLWALVDVNCVEGFNIKDMFVAINSIRGMLEREELSTAQIVGNTIGGLLSAEETAQIAAEGRDELNRQLSQITINGQSASNNPLADGGFRSIILGILLNSPRCANIQSNAALQTAFLAEAETFLSLLARADVAAETINAAIDYIGLASNDASISQPNSSRAAVGRNGNSYAKMPLIAEIRQSGTHNKISYPWAVLEIFCNNPEDLRLLNQALVSLIYKRPGQATPVDAYRARAAATRNRAPLPQGMASTRARDGRAGGRVQATATGAE